MNSMWVVLGVVSIGGGGAGMGTVRPGYPDLYGVVGDAMHCPMRHVMRDGWACNGWACAGWVPDDSMRDTARDMSRDTTREITRDTVRLRALQAEAERADPRARELVLYRKQSQLRLRNISAEQLPALMVQGDGQYQSDVTSIPITLPGGQHIPTPKHDTYDAHLGVRESLLDFSAAPRRAVERAQLAASEARVETMLFTVRSQVNDAFFTVVTLQERDRMLAATVADLEAQLTDAKARVQAGTALPSTVAAIRAAILQHEQERQTVAANRDAAISTLESLTGQALDPRATFALPDLTAAVTAARGRLEHIRERPEYTQFARARDLLKVQGDVITSQDKPRVSLFGRAGYGRPGLNMLSTQFDSYWLGGIEVQWSPWTWGTTRRQREALVLQQQIVDADAAAFTENVQRSATRDLITIDRLVATMAADSDIVTLREQIEQTARAQLHEGVITASEYVGRSTDVLIARLARSAHKVELVEAQVRFLTTLGLEVR